MMAAPKKIISWFGCHINRQHRRRHQRRLYEKYREYTMIPACTYINNLSVAESIQNVPGAVVECGVWRGGMIAGLADLLGKSRDYWLFDSFEGLPPAREVDGEKALAWQRNVESPTYYDNCMAPETSARKAMALSGARSYHVVRGWFEESLARPELPLTIALLRLDGDWYDSTLCCLQRLVPRLAPGGVVIIDDYHTWDGCARALHDYMAQMSVALRICQWNNDVCYFRLPTGISRMRLQECPS